MWIGFLVFGCKSDLDSGPLAPSPRLYRLTHDQWEHTTRDLLGLEAESGLSAGFIGDTLHEGFANSGDALAVNAELFRDYQVAAETLASQVVRDREAYQRVVPQDSRGALDVVAQRFEVEDEPTMTTDNGAPSGNGWMLWSDGSLYLPVTLAEAGTYALSASMSSSDCGDGVYGEAELALDGAVLGTFTTTASDATYAAEGYADVGDHTLKVTFTNDCYEDPNDRNLIVDAVQIEGPLDGLGEGTAGDAEAKAWITDFGGRAFRRPLTDAEIDTWTGVFAQGDTLVGSGDTFKDGVQLVITAMLQSPAFVYRIEASTAEEGGRVRLDGYEIASKLSYALWGTMPDAALFAVARDGGLDTDEGVREIAAQMLEDPRSHEAVADFHAQLLHLDKTANISKDPDRFPAFTREMPAFIREEPERFVDAVVWEDDGGLADLLDADFTVANASLAGLYGAAGPRDDATWDRVALDPAERAGLLSQAWFLATNADSTTPSPIHRGVFINRDVLCVTIPDPPPNVPPLPASEAGVTNRERVDAHTGEGTCGAGCHATRINPPGYAFEAYDALGGFRTTDGGVPVDASGSYEFTDGVQTWTDGRDFLTLLASHPDTHTCYATHWLEYLLSRPATELDAPAAAALGAESLDGASVRELILALVSSDRFRYRADEVTP